MATMGTYKYGTQHRKERDKVAKQVEAGYGWCCEIVCVMPTRWIPPGSKWHLAHLPDGVGYRGPAHDRCNEGEGGRRGNPKGIKASRGTSGLRLVRKQPPRRWRPTTDW